MKKAILLYILFTSIVITNIQSQDWKPFRLDRKSILTGAEDIPSRAIKFDSISIQGIYMERQLVPGMYFVKFATKNGYASVRKLIVVQK